MPSEAPKLAEPVVHLKPPHGVKSFSHSIIGEFNIFSAAADRRSGTGYQRCLRCATVPFTVCKELLTASLRLCTAFAPIRRSAVFCIIFHIGNAPAYPVLMMLLASDREAKSANQLYRTHRARAFANEWDNLCHIHGPHASFQDLNLRPDPRSLPCRPETPYDPSL